jgi:glycine cleavage system H protein
MNFPEDLKYTADHEWIRLDGDSAYVGITAFAARELGDIVFIDINTEGQALEANAVFGSVEAVKTVSDLFLPVAATIVEFNPALKDKPELVNEDPYNEGWMVKIKPAQNADFSELMDVEAYKATINE